MIIVYSRKNNEIIVVDSNNEKDAAISIYENIIEERYKLDDYKDASIERKLDIAYSLYDFLKFDEIKAIQKNDKVICLKRNDYIKDYETMKKDIEKHLANDVEEIEEELEF